MKIKISHIAKIEGEAGFVADIVKGQVKMAKIKVKEGARLIEAILVGRKYYEAPEIVSRICGICPVVHNLTALQAIEDAFKIKISKQTEILRKLMMLGQLIHSHSLHLFFFSLSDFFGYPDDLILFKKHPQLTKTIIRLRGLGNKIIKVIGGRSIHPITTTIGGFRKLPPENEISQLLEDFKANLSLAIKVAEFFNNLTYPQFERETNFFSLISKNEYAIYRGKVKCWGEKIFSAKEALREIREFQKRGEVVKGVSYKQKSYMVGALARLHNNAQQLNREAKKILEKSKIKLPCFNPFYNILAQAIEIIHCLEEGIKLLKILPKIKPEKPRSKFKTGLGIGVMEAPRGLLYHSYRIDKNGFITFCNIITPTCQNLINLEEDLKTFLKKWKKKDRKQKIKMLIRAYDPCIPCVVH